MYEMLRSEITTAMLEDMLKEYLLFRDYGWVVEEISKKAKDTIESLTDEQRKEILDKIIKTFINEDSITDEIRNIWKEVIG